MILCVASNREHREGWGEKQRLEKGLGGSFPRQKRGVGGQGGCQSANQHRGMQIKAPNIGALALLATEGGLNCKGREEGRGGVRRRRPAGKGPGAARSLMKKRGAGGEERPRHPTPHPGSSITGRRRDASEHPPPPLWCRGLPYLPARGARNPWRRRRCSRGRRRPGS